MLDRDRLRQGAREACRSSLPPSDQEESPPTAGTGRGLDDGWQAGWVSDTVRHQGCRTGAEMGPRSRPLQPRPQVRGGAGLGPVPGRSRSGCHTAVLSRPDHASRSSTRI